MSKHRIKFKLPFFGEAEAEGLHRPRHRRDGRPMR
jgi:hypothetical protein